MLTQVDIRMCCVHARATACDRVRPRAWPCVSCAHTNAPFCSSCRKSPRPRHRLARGPYLARSQAPDATKQVIISLFYDTALSAIILVAARSFSRADRNYPSCTRKGTHARNSTPRFGRAEGDGCVRRTSDGPLHRFQLSSRRNPSTALRLPIPSGPGRRQHTHGTHTHKHSQSGGKRSQRGGWPGRCRCRDRCHDCCH